MFVKKKKEGILEDEFILGDVGSDDEADGQ